jgi:hypothetical protein
MVATEGTSAEEDRDPRNEDRERIGSRGDAPTSDTVRLVAHGVGAFAVGSVLAPLTFTITRVMVSPYGPVTFDPLDVLPAVLVLVAAGLSLVGPLRRYAWLVSAAGLAGAAGLFLQGDVLPRDALYSTLALVMGLQLGGLLLALGAASARARWAIVVGAGVGIVAGRYSAVLLTDELRRTLVRATTHSDVLVIGLAAALAMVAGLLLAVVPTEAAAGAAAWREPVIGIAVAAVVGEGLMLAWQAVQQSIARSSTGGISQQRAEVVESLSLLAHVLIGAMVTVVLLVVAYRRGGANLARWVVVGFALAMAGVGIPFGVALNPSSLAPVAAGAAVGAALGAVAVRRLDGAFPWDALGVAIAALGLLLVSPRGRLELPELFQASTVVTSFGVALALTAGLARVANPHGRGLSAPDVGLSAALGFAVLILGAQSVVPVIFIANAPYGSLQLHQTLSLAVAAVVLLGLFGLGRLVTKIRRDLVEEARAQAQG